MPGLLAKLFNHFAVSPGPRLSPKSSSFLAFSSLVSAGNTDVVEGLHLLFTACFLLLTRLRELDYGVNAAPFAFSSNNFLCGSRVLSVGRKRHNAAH